MTETAVESWRRCAELVRSQVSEAVWLTTFREITALDLSEQALRVAVTSSVTRDRIEHRYRSMVQAALEDVGLGDHDLVIEVRAETDSLLRAPTTVPAAPIAVVPPPNARDDGRAATLPATVAPNMAHTSTVGFPRQQLADDMTGAGINPRYTFEDFVIGSSNRFAHAAAMAVAEQPGKSYNPLTIQGGAGLGKTHLLHAIMSFVTRIYPNMSIRYVSSEVFMNEFVESIRNSTGAEFKRRYRENDILLVDDIQFLENKESLQEEFFHTFNSIHGAGRQIVMTSDRPPRAIATLEERLRSRFEWGLITDIQPPDLETRLAILHKKSAELTVEVPPQVLDFIASNIRVNIRELEGALIRISAFASLTHEPLTVEVATKVLSDIVGELGDRAITTQEILDAVITKFGFTEAELIGKRRYKALVNARQIAMYVTRELTDLSYPSIARVYGNRDHTTVMHAIRRVEDRMRERRDVYDAVDGLIQKLKCR